MADDVAAVQSGGIGDAELSEMQDQLNEGQSAEHDFLDLFDTCSNKARP